MLLQLNKEYEDKFPGLRYVYVPSTPLPSDLHHHHHHSFTNATQGIRKWPPTPRHHGKHARPHRKGRYQGGMAGSYSGTFALDCDRELITNVWTRQCAI